MIESELDLLSFFNPNEFGTLCSHSSGDFYGIFETITIDYDGGITTISTRTPTLLARTQDTTLIEQGDVLVVGENTYSVTDIRPDGTGVTTIGLHLQ